MRRGRGDRGPLGHAEAVAELRRCAGTRFDPAVVDAAVDVIDPAGARPTVRLRVAAI
jgi:HD-GYP domain-containing protein (c-di-GMP phosphodiesterase class II)